MPWNQLHGIFVDLMFVKIIHFQPCDSCNNSNKESDDFDNNK
jgi:hypothetical protein